MVGNHERPTGATELEVATIAEARKNLSNLAKEENRINKALAPLLAQVRPLEEQLAGVQDNIRAAQYTIQRVQYGIDARERAARHRAEQERLKAIEQEMRAQEEARWRVVVDSVQQKATIHLEALSQSTHPLSQDIAGVVDQVLENPDFVWHLPNIVEESLDTAVSRTNNADRIRVRAENDSSRLILLSDGTFGVIYNPKPDTEQMRVATEMADRIELAKGEIPNRHIFGVHINPTTDTATPFFATRRESFQGVPYTPRVVPVSEIAAIPLLATMHDILSQGAIDLPKKFGRATISPPASK